MIALESIKQSLSSLSIQIFSSLEDLFIKHFWREFKKIWYFISEREKLPKPICDSRIIHRKNQLIMITIRIEDINLTNNWVLIFEVGIKEEPYDIYNQ